MFAVIFFVTLFRKGFEFFKIVRVSFRLKFEGNFSKTVAVVTARRKKLTGLSPVKEI